MEMHRMRTINDALYYLKSHDPETSITSYTIRTLCKKRVIWTVRVGNRILLDLDSLLAYLYGSDKGSGSAPAMKQAASPVRHEELPPQEEVLDTPVYYTSVW